MPSKTLGTQPLRFRRPVAPYQYQHAQYAYSRQLSTQSQTRPSQLASRQMGSTIPLPTRSRIHTTSVHQADVQTFQPIRPIDSADVSASMIAPSVVSATADTTFSPIVEAPAVHDADAKQPLVLSKSLQSLLPALESQRPHYITAHIHSFPYLLTEGDTLRLPFHMHGVMPGDVLRFNRATILGSRDYTLKAGFSSPQHSSPPHVRGEAFINKRRTGEPNYIDERLFECRMRVMGLDSGPMVTEVKKKRRIRRMKTVNSKHKYTVLKVMEVRVKTLDELMAVEGEQVVLE